jgi:maltooligosyltrehalose trehalohydrolase
VWAPYASDVQLLLAGTRHLMYSDSGGRWRTDVEAPGGSDYAFVLDGNAEPLPDPASRRQPSGVHGLSRLYDQSAFEWTDQAWTGRALPGSVIYELHVATFTAAGTFDSAIERLDHLVELGITHVELLPVNAVNGTWNWGYDGVDWYAVHEPLGGPDGLKRFVDAAHRSGLAVVLDVVYNHLGPSGNYLPRFGPYLKTGRNTWGDLLNLEAEPVRRFIVDNALMWFADFHVDALRLDAVHALIDSSTPHLLEQLAVEVDVLAAHLGRPLILIAESDLNDPVMITDRAAGGYGLDAQWDDDVHHALHSLLTGETQGYYCDFGSLAVLAKVLTSAFLHDGTYSTFRRRIHGRPVDRTTTPGYRFVVCLQNHDQVGNRAVGDRLTELASPAIQRIGAVLLLTAPFTPMLWMGEEWAAATRWPFFTSHPEPDLAEATARGRIAEFSSHGWNTEAMIDPQDPAAFQEAVLDWSELGRPAHRDMLTLYRELIGLRRREADLTDPRLDRVRVDYDEDARWIVVHRGRLRVVANLGPDEQTLGVDSDDIIFSTGPADLTASGLLLAGRTAAIVRIVAGHDELANCDS